MTRQLQDLPAEIQLCIADQMESGDKLNLMSCSHHFYDLVLPLLYRDIKLAGESFQDIACLVNTLLAKPSRCVYARTFHITAWDVFYEEEEEEISEDRLAEYHVKCDMSLVSEKWKELGTWPADEADRICGLKNANADAWVGFLLTLLPNLVCLEIQFPHGSRYVPCVVDRAAEGGFNIPVLERVEEVFVTALGDEFQGELTTFSVGAFLGLPSLRRFYTDALSDKFEPGRLFLRFGSPVTHLWLSFCTGVKHLGKLISRCEKLESYRHHFFPHVVDDPQPDALSFYYGLLPAKRTLKTIWLDLHHSYFRRDGDDSVVWSTFMEFASLKTLHVPVFLLANFQGTRKAAPILADVLPSSIEIIHLTGIRESAIPRLLPCLLDYVESGKSPLAELIFQSASPIIVAMQYLKPGREDVSDQHEDQDIQNALKLRAACGRLNIKLRLYEEHSALASLDFGEFYDPFEDTH